MPSPSISSRDEFLASIAVLRDLKINSNLFISLSPPFSLAFEVDHEVLSSVLKQHNLSERQFQSHSTFIRRALVALLEDDRDLFLQHESLPDDGDEVDEDAVAVRREELQQRMDAVKEAIFDEMLVRRYRLKKSSKAPSFTSIDWDIKVKLADAKIRDLRRFPYATFRISFQKEFDVSPMTILSRDAFGSVQVNFSADELNHVIRVLTTVRERLQETEREVADDHR